MRVKTRTLVVMASTAAMAFLGVGAVNADVGDGKLACNYGEICFNRDAGNRYYQKHFWKHGSHINLTFTDVRNGATNKGKLRDNAYSVRNRDTKCPVKVIDDRGIMVDDVHEIPNDSRWYTLKRSVRDQNDRHERCDKK